MKRARLLALLGCAFLLLLLTAVGLALQQGGDLEGFIAAALAQGAVYLAALGLVWRWAAARGVVAVILATAVAMRLAVLLAPPFLSTDIYRYVWDGRVIAAGINPYRYIPTDPHLASLRDAAIFPNINRSTYARTIYSPLAEVIFYGVTRVSERLVAMKAAMTAFDLAAMALLLAALMASRQPPARIVVYAWHPLPLWEFAGSGHIDAALVACVALALWARLGGGRLLTGLALAGATLVKLYPALLLPALWRRWDWRMPAVFAAAVALAYLPFLGVGWRIFGFVPGYVGEEGFASGGGFYLLGLVRAAAPAGAFPTLAYIAAAGLSLIALAFAIALSRLADRDPVFAATLLAAAFMLLLSPHYPWYFAWLLVFACLMPSLSLLWLTVASFLLYLVPVGSQLVRDRHRLLVESVLYLPFVALAGLDLWRRSRKQDQEQLRHGDSKG
ncbi:MAG: glycosyltransferase 87 family protein [Thiohalocapsa sp.]